MADSAEQQATGTGLTNSVSRVLQWTMGQVFGLIFTSVLAGTGSLYLMVRAGFLDASGQVTALESTVEHRFDKIEEMQTALDRKLESLGKLDEIEETLDTSVRKLEDAWGHRKSEHEELEKSIGSFGSKVNQLFEDTRGDLEQHISTTTDSATREVVAEQMRLAGQLREQISALSNQLAAVHSAFVDRLEDLAEEGKRLMRERDFIAIGRWIEKTNYMVRSLAIPTEEGLLKDTSAVNNDLREAMERFGKEQDDDARMAHAQRVLVIVEAVRELAVGGRIP